MLSKPSIYVTGTLWKRARPGTLVVACSDGRLQENLDDFLHQGLGIAHYDRLYAPGGGGVLSRSGSDFLRSDHFRSECKYLINLHAVTDLYLIFHGPSSTGPEEALCADYRRKMPWASVEEVRHQQSLDARDAMSLAWDRPVRMHAYGCEVTRDDAVRFIAL
ncbi:MAG: hypothetical protein FJ319_03290 [SAR202 cluster bacterium]|nr:hypothetical protein [SAR202 cluster bacterium]